MNSRGCDELPTGDCSRWVFGDYELLEEIGRGGMGTVNRARPLSGSLHPAAGLR